MFRKYFSIEGSWRNKEIQMWLDIYPTLKDEEYILQEKIHGCLSEDIMLDAFEYGKISIGKIVNENIQCKVKSYNIKTNEITYQPIINTFNQSCNDDIWIEIELENVKKITVTENHYIWIPKENIWRKAKNLNGNEELLIT